MSFLDTNNPTKALARAKAYLKGTVKRDEYYNILTLLPIVDPLWEDMAKFCPHLTLSQAVSAFNKDNGYVACPPLKVKGAFQIINYTKPRKEGIYTWFNGRKIRTGTRQKPGRLDYAFSGRATHRKDITFWPHSTDKLKTIYLSNYQQTNEAISYAEKKWSDSLITDTWKSVVEIYLQDPSDLINNAYHNNQQKTKMILRIALDRELNDISNDYSLPESMLFDKEISTMTTNPMVWQEIKGGRGSYTEFNCAYCGAGLSLNGCSGCGHTFLDNGWRCGWYTPLSKKMVKYIESNGLVFKKNPSKAWAEETNQFNKYWETNTRKAA